MHLNITLGTLAKDKKMLTTEVNCHGFVLLWFSKGHRNYKTGINV